MDTPGPDRYCPICLNGDIPGIARRCATQARPAQCESCGALSYVQPEASSGISMLSVLLFIAMAAIGASLQSWPLILIGAGAATAYNSWAWKRAKLTALDTQHKAYQGWTIPKNRAPGSPGKAT